MLQKILVVIVGLVMSLVGALSPEGLFASESGPDPLGVVPAGIAEETLATVRLADKAAFARVPILWAEVDGKRVVEDAWGTGEVKELRFKVGVKGVEGTALLVGDRQVTLEPTDVLTIRMFKGDFSFRGVGTPQATLQLQGDVKTTTLAKGESNRRVLTQLNGTPEEGGLRPADGRVAYVVLTTGQKVDTVALEDGGGRLYTEEATEAAQAKAEPGNLLAKWVKIDGKMVREYTWGEGTLQSIEFEPAEGATRSVVVAFEDQPTRVEAGTRVLVKDFVGEYLVYQVAGGQLRLRLDGYAGQFDAGVRPSAPAVSSGGLGSPLASFEFAPGTVRTTDTVRFRDLSTPAEGSEIVLRRWDFGDGSADVRRDPTHRFEKPGVYEVTLTVTDLELRASQVKRTVTVLNAEPLADFEFAPKRVQSGGLVSFTDLSRDADGVASNWTWDFGDGTVSHSRHPSHRFTRGGAHTVTLTVQDDLHGVASVSKTVTVVNVNPVAGFSYHPAAPASLSPVQFFDNSTDSDGHLVSWEWSFGDGAKGTGPTPTHTYARPGPYTVTLTAIDNNGGVTTVTQGVLVANRPPQADFVWTPVNGTAQTPVEFVSTSEDRDGVILATLWDFGDGTPPGRDSPVSHVFPRAGVYTVTISVTDNLLATTTLTRTVAIANAAPRADFVASPDPTWRNVPITFTDLSRDPDGDPVVERTWSFGDGTAPVSGPQVVRHAYPNLGVYPVTLRVRDDQGNMANVTRAIQVVNQAPVAAFTMEPAIPLSGQDIWLNATSVDPDNSAGETTYLWTFSDGRTAQGRSVLKNFSDAGRATITLQAVDGEGGRSAPVSKSFDVQLAVPNARFTFTPAHPTAGQQVTFVDESTSPNGPIQRRHWEFKDSNTVDSKQVVNHSFAQPGPKVVSLTVWDNFNRDRTTQLTVFVNAPPAARFEVPNGVLPLGKPVKFTDATEDTDTPNKLTLRYEWNFGDGSPVLATTAGDVTHVYQLPGPRVVTLTVTDEHGGVGTATQVVHVQNQRPVARWALATAAPRAGEPVSFVSSGHAYDPDGSGHLVGWNWTFGDGSLGRGENPVHTYARSGVYTVNLQVTDGLLQSATEPGSYRSIRVGSAHPITVNVIGRFPDGRDAPLMQDRFQLWADVGQNLGGFTRYTKADFAVNPSAGIDLRLPEGAWLEGDRVVVGLRDTAFMSRHVEKSVTLVETDGIRTVITLVFDIPIPLRTSIQIEPGTAYAVLPVNPFRNGSSTEGGEPIYRMPTEDFHGTGVVTFVDGFPAHKAAVTLYARYVPLAYVASTQDSARLDQMGGAGLLGWCTAGQEETAVDGTFAWRLQSSDCLSTAMHAYPVGRWEVKAVAMLGVATAGTSTTVRAWVDPTGGNLANLPLP